MAVIDGIILKSKQTVIPKELQKRVTDQLHSNHMGIKRQDYQHIIPYIGYA